MRSSAWCKALDAELFPACPCPGTGCPVHFCACFQAAAGREGRGVCTGHTAATPAVSPWSHSYALLTPSSALEVFTAADFLAIKALIDNAYCLSGFSFHYCLV